MLQRIQTLLMALIVLALIVLFYVPVFEIPNPLLHVTQTVCVSKSVGLNLSSSVSLNWISLILTIAAAVLTTFSITQFKNRPLQLKLGLLNTLLLVSLLGSMIYYKITFINQNPEFAKMTEGKFGLGFFIPAICLIMNMISIRFIRRDERLVKDAFDRLR